ncbi:MAG: glycosyltransferase family 4 protein, partial [Candidatus Paceibacterales bacterium]
DFDVIHAHDWLSFLAGIRAHRISGKPLVVQIHSTEFDRTGNTTGNYEVFTIEKNGMELADSVIAVSNFTKNVITDKYGISPNKVHVVHNGIAKPGHSPFENDVLELKKHNRIVLFVGRLTLQKGPDYFLKAAKKVLEYESNVVFLMVGDGDMKEQLIREAVHAGISDKVIFTGFLRDSELKKIYKSADLFVMPSVSEPFGIAGLESAINGTPVLLSKQSGISEILTHALKVDFWDIDEMTNKILAVLQHPPLKHTLKKHTLMESHLHTWHKAAKKVKNIYNSVINKTSA